MKRLDVDEDQIGEADTAIRDAIYKEAATKKTFAFTLGREGGLVRVRRADGTETDLAKQLIANGAKLTFGKPIRGRKSKSADAPGSSPELEEESDDADEDDAEDAPDAPSTWADVAAADRQIPPDSSPKRGRPRKS